MPIVSVLLPTYKNPPYLKRVIATVKAQSFSDWELIIIDDGLADVSKELINNFIEIDKRIILYSNPKNLGIQKSLNQGLSMAKGKYIARIDDDDFWIDRDKLQKQVDFLEANSDYVLTGTDGTICDENLVDLQNYSMPKSDLEIRNRILFKNCFLHSTVLIDKTALTKANFYMESKKVRNVEDYDLWLRLGQIGKIANLDSRSVRLIVGNSSITSKNRLNQAIRDISLTFRYRKYYPYFYFALILGFLRLIFFYLNYIFPIPKKVLYKIQTLYKAI